MSSHRCHAIGCIVEVPPRMFMCRSHWRLLPEGLQKAIWHFYRPGQEIDKRPSYPYVLVQIVSRICVCELEGKKPPKEIQDELVDVMEAAIGETLTPLRTEISLRELCQLVRAKVAETMTSEGRGGPVSSPGSTTMAELQTVLNMNWGQNIAPKGTGAASVPRGPYIGTVKVCGVGPSRKNASLMGLRVTVGVTAPEQVGDIKTSGVELEAWFSLPEGNDFSQDTPVGRGNRARVAEIKSFFLSVSNNPEWVMARNNLEQIDLAQILNNPVRFHFEPAPPPTVTEKMLPDGTKRSDTEVHYADFTWLSKEAYDKVVAGTIVIQPKVVKPTGAGAAPQGPGPVGMGGMGGAGPATAQPPTATPPATSFINQPPGTGGMAPGAPLAPPPVNGAGAGTTSAANAAAALVGIPGLP